LREKEYLEKRPEEDFCDRECEVRKLFLKVFNKKSKDFASEDQYDSYLEKVEDMIAAMVDRTTSEQDKLRIKKLYEDEKRVNGQAIGNKNAESEEQMKIFKSIADLH